MSPSPLAHILSVPMSPSPLAHILSWHISFSEYLPCKKLLKMIKFLKKEGCERNGRIDTYDETIYGSKK